MHNPEDHPEQEESPFFSHIEVKEFFERNKMEQEDVGLIEGLSDLPPDLIVKVLHNTFNLLHEKSGENLKAQIATLETRSSGHFVNDFDAHKNKRTKELCEMILYFFSKYGWQKSYSRVRVLEAYAPKKSVFKDFELK